MQTLLVVMPLTKTALVAEQHLPAQECHGTGVQVMMRPLGPGMMQQIQQPCSNCRQTGFAPPPQDLCPACSGKVRQPCTSTNPVCRMAEACCLGCILPTVAELPRMWVWETSSLSPEPAIKVGAKI